MNTIRKRYLWLLVNEKLVENGKKLKRKKKNVSGIPTVLEGGGTLLYK